MAITKKDFKAITEKMDVVNTLMREVKDLLESSNFETTIFPPTAVELYIPDLLDLAKVAGQKVKVRDVWGMWELSFTLYGTKYKAITFLEEKVKLALENGAEMEGANNA